MDFKDLLNEIVGSDWFTQLTNYLQTLALIIVAAISAKLKSKFTVSSDAYNKNLSDISNSLGVNAKDIVAVKDKIVLLKDKLDKSDENNKILIQVLGLFLMDSKSIAANTKVAISKLLGKINDEDLVEQIETVVEESKQEETVTVEEVNEIKQEIKETANLSDKNAESIAQQTLNIYKELIDE